MLAIAALFAFGIHRWLHAVIPRSTDRPADAIGRLRVGASRLLVDLAALGAFGLGGWLSVRWLLPAPDMAHALGVHLIRYGSTAALFWIGGRFLLAPRDPESRLFPLPNGAWHVRMLATYGALGAVLEFVASLARQAAAIRRRSGWFLLGGTIITIFKIAWFWSGRHDITALFRELSDAIRASSGARRRRHCPIS